MRIITECEERRKSRRLELAAIIHDYEEQDDIRLTGVGGKREREEESESCAGMGMRNHQNRGSKR